MSSFNNIQQQGDWKLNVADGNSGSGHTGTVTLNSWSLSITPAVCAAVPAPPAPTTPPGGQNQTPSPPPTPDTTAPVLGIGGVPNTLTRKAFLGGVKFAATTNEAATLTCQLLGATAKAQLAAKKKPKPPPFNLVLGSGRSPFAPGLRTLKAKPSKRLLGRAKRFTVKVVVTATDAAGNRSSKSAKIKITP